VSASHLLSFNLIETILHFNASAVSMGKSGGPLKGGGLWLFSQQIGKAWEPFFSKAVRKGAVWIM